MYRSAYRRVHERRRTAKIRKSQCCVAPFLHNCLLALPLPVCVYDIYKAKNVKDNNITIITNNGMEAGGRLKGRQLENLVKERSVSQFKHEK